MEARSLQLAAVHSSLAQLSQQLLLPRLEVRTQHHNTPLVLAARRPASQAALSHCPLLLPTLCSPRRRAASSAIVSAQRGGCSTSSRPNGWRRWGRRLYPWRQHLQSQIRHRRPKGDPSQATWFISELVFVRHKWSLTPFSSIPTEGADCCLELR